MKCFFLAAATGLALASFGDGRDGLMHWWKVKDLNGDGLLQAGEVYDVMTVGAEKPLTGEHVYQSTDVEVGAKPVAIVNDVYMPTMRRNASDGAMRFYNPTNYTANGKLKINYQSVKLSQSASIGSRQATVFARIKWDGARFKASTGNYNFNVPIYANNFNDKAKTGWMVGLRCFDSGTSNRFHPYFCFGNQEVGFHYGKFATEEEKKAAQNFVIYKDKWYDVVYSYKVENIDGIEKIHAAALYRSNDAGAVARKHVYKALPLQKVENTWEMSEESVYAPHIGFHRMADGTGGTESFVDAGKDDGFTGAIHEIKVYNRWMGENEMLQCLGQKDPICSVGSKNDCADEFCDNDVQEVFEPETMPWSKMRKTLHSQCPSVSIKCSIRSYERNLPRLMEIKFLKDTGFAGDSVRLDMNGVKIGRLGIPADGMVRFFIPAAKFAKLAVDEETGKCPVLFTLTRKGEMQGNLRFDALSIDGAWQLGKSDNSNAEFAASEESYLNYTYHVGQNDLNKLRASMMGVNANGATGYMDLDMHFAVGDYLSANCDYMLTLKSVGVNNAAINLYLNDMASPVDSVSIGGLKDSKTWTFPAGTLLGGGNSLRIRNTNTSGSWVSIDYFRLEPVIPEGWRNSDEGITVKVR